MASREVVKVNVFLQVSKGSYKAFHFSNKPLDRRTVSTVRLANAPFGPFMMRTVYSSKSVNSPL
jgi:hypothetical protein